jgi:hypothetical protein
VGFSRQHGSPSHSGKREGFLLSGLGPGWNPQAGSARLRDATAQAMAKMSLSRMPAAASFSAMRRVLSALLLLLTVLTPR